jgi:hypothetical protein
MIFGCKSPMMISPLALGFSMLAGQLCGVAQATSPCERGLVAENWFVEEQIAGSTNAFRARVTEVSGMPETPATARAVLNGYDQTLTFQVLDSWKGAYQIGALAHTTVRVVTICAGFGCMFPFKAGDVVLVLSPASGDYHVPALFEECWRYNGIATNKILTLPSI